MLLGLAAAAPAQPAQQPLTLLDVPFISQSEALCGGAAAAMVLRFWGERELSAESFSHLVDRSAAGIRTGALIAELRQRGWNAVAVAGSETAVAHELAQGRPVLALIEDRPGTLHYIVIVAAHERAVVFHDPARAPFRVMPRGEFVRRWAAAESWMAVVTPAAAPSAKPARGGSDPAHGPPCSRLIAHGVELAQSGELDGAERVLTSAVSCPGPDAFRELAGVRLLQRRWADVDALASAALAADASDVHAWRLLATSRFVQSDPAGALRAWNRAGEPRIDLIRVDGLVHTRHRVVERLFAVAPGSVLTERRFARSARRLAELPSAVSTRLEYVPVPSGLAELRAGVLERQILPTDRWSLTAIALGAAVRRQVDVPVGAVSGAGERVVMSWRYWERRPRYAVDLAVPAPWGGIVTVGASVERQPFTLPAIPAARRESGRIGFSDWLAGGLRWQLSAGVDRWSSSGLRPMAGASVRLVSSNGRVDAQGGVQAWGGTRGFAVTQGTVALKTSEGQSGTVLLAVGGVGQATGNAPPDLWFAGDTGHVRPLLLRAHPALEDGALRAGQLGRQAAHATVEARRWWAVPAGARVGGAVFADTARVSHRYDPGPRTDIDAGVGIRLGLPGVRGVVRLDLAKGLRDGATAFSVAYDP